MTTKGLWVFCLLVLEAVLTSGCGGPRYPDSPDNSIKAERTMSGAKFEIHNKADTDASAKGIKFNKQTGMFECDEFTFRSAQSKNQEMMIQWMQMYALQQTNYYHGLAENATANWQGATGLISAAAPVAGQYLNGMNVVKGMKVMRPNAIEDAAMAMAAGKISPEALSAAFPPEDMQAIVGKVAAIAKTAQAAAQPATP